MTEARSRTRAATKGAGRAGLGFALAATTVAAMAVPAGAAAPAVRHSTTPAATVGATALALPRIKAPASLPTAPVAMTYRVQAGDTVSHIALRTGASIQAIIAENRLDSRALIRVGQMLRIPVPGSAAPAPSTPAPAARSHVVARGETVSGLAKRYGTSVSAIVSANSLNSRALILVGQRLSIPGAAAATPSTPAAPAPAAPAPSAPTTGTHTVARGETVSGLAKRYGTSVSAIVSANSLNSRALIMVGQRLTIPGASAPSAPSAPSASAPTGLVGDTFLGRTYPQHVVGAANVNKATLLSLPVPSRDEMRARVASTARSMGVDPALALAVAQTESGFDARAVSPANAIGVMQVIPSSGEWASDLVGRDLNLLDPDDNVVAGVAILRQLLRAAPNQATAIAGYYQGLAGVTRNGMYPDTRNYVAKIQALMAQYR
ncbi:lytic transglycosylase [Georgenia wangjunii]|uniref:lytic transglycosylase n=1 Tax=Georgenia wangjunii TaxID=3117730 RepID=UPI002F266B0E